MEGRNFTWTMVAGEELDDLTLEGGDLFKVIALDSGKKDGDPLMAGGILLYGGRKGEHITLGYLGIMKFVAKGDLGKGKPLTVVEGGFLSEAEEGDYVVGRVADLDVSDGCVGTGMFNFANITRL